MAVTLVTRAGSSLKANLFYWAPDKVELMPSEGYTARLQLRSTNGTQRVLLNTKAVSDPPTAPLVLVEESHWRLNLNGGFTKTLPPTTRFEMELVNDLDPDDVITLVAGTINVNPQAVTNE